MSKRVLIIPDKFKGTLTAPAAAQAMADGWKEIRPKDRLELLPMSDGGDGFGEVIGRLLRAKAVAISTVDSAHQPRRARWWWEPKTRTAVIESAEVIGLALLLADKFHPFELDTFGLGAVFKAAARKGARHCIVGIGGSSTNDGGFGLVRALGWRFPDHSGKPIQTWPALAELDGIEPPQKPKLFPRLTVAVDVQNPLLGPRGATRVYGPQKGLKDEDFPAAEKALRRLADVAARRLGKDFRREPGAGAAGGLGFGLMTFLGAQPKPGFDLFARHAGLPRRIRSADLVITGEGSIDRSSLMGKGAGEVAALCKQFKVPCIGIAGTIVASDLARHPFQELHCLTNITSPEKARANAGHWLEKLTANAAREVKDAD